eukprot:6052139-Amphidinium_carterae.1
MRFITGCHSVQYSIPFPEDTPTCAWAWWSHDLMATRLFQACRPFASPTSALRDGLLPAGKRA